MTAAPKFRSLWKLLGRDYLTCRTPFLSREAVALGEAMSERIRETWRGMGPSAFARIAERMSGRAISQPRLATTGEDPVYEVSPRHREGFGLTHESV